MAVIRCSYFVALLRWWQLWQRSGVLSFHYYISIFLAWFLGHKLHNSFSSCRVPPTPTFDLRHELYRGLECESCPFPRWDKDMVNSLRGGLVMEKILDVFQNGFFSPPSAQSDLLRFSPQEPDDTPGGNTQESVGPSFRSRSVPLSF